MSGLITAEIMNWTGHVLVGSRSGLPVFLKRSETERTGIYFLIGPDPKDPDILQVYIGESDNVSKRLRQHSNDDKKDFWERTCVVTSNDQYITKAHVLYLESELISMAKLAGTASVVNEKASPQAALPEADNSDMKRFINQLLLIFPVLGLNFLPRPKDTVPKDIGTNKKRGDTVQVYGQFWLERKKHGLEAKAHEEDGEFVVMAGSSAAREWSSESKPSSYSRLHAQLINSNKLKPEAKEGNLKFATDYAFTSASAASSVILGQQSNGRILWKVRNSDLIYDKWQKEQVCKTDSQSSNVEEDGGTPG